MNMTLTPLRKAKGSVLVLTALSLIVLMGMAALAIDLSHADVNKTRLQNLADSLALSAAISLNKGDNPTTAEASARTTLAYFKNSNGNAEINTAIASTTSPLDFAFTFAKISDLNASTAGDWKAAAAISDANFVRVTSLTTPMNISTWFARVIDFNNMAVSNSAVAGTTPINPCLNVLPIMMCAQTNNPNAPADSEGSKIDTNCNNNNDNSGFTNTNNDCYGYERDVVYATKQSKWQSGDVGPGNFGYFDVGAGGAAIRECLAGDPGCTANLCTLLVNPDPTLSSETGNMIGPTQQGLNTRFDDFTGPIKYTGVFPLPDSIVNHSLSTTARDPFYEFDPSKSYTTTSEQVYNSYYKDHYSSTNDLTSGHTFIPGRRLVTMPFVACPGNTNGKKELEIVGYGCWFLTSPTDGKTIYQEFLGKEGEGCNVSGTTTSTNDFGFYKVQLYKDPFGGHS